MRRLLVLLDGAVDEPSPSLGYRTPLEAAKKPFIDKLASSGLVARTGAFLHTHEFLESFLIADGRGIARGVLEAIALNISLKRGAAAYRISPARLYGSTITLNYDLSGEELQNLESLIDKFLPMLSNHNPKICFRNGRGVLILENPETRIAPSSPFEEDPLARLPKELREFVHAIASRNSGLTILPWGGGIYKDIRLKPRADNISIVSGSPAVHGLAKLSGLKAYTTNRVENLIWLTGRLFRSSAVLLHFERPDEESHKRSVFGKLSAIEEIDAILEEIYLESNCPIAILIDHGSSTRTGRHFKAETPLIYAEKPSEEQSRNFCEKLSGEFIPTNRLLEILFSPPRARERL